MYLNKVLNILPKSVLGVRIGNNFDFRFHTRTLRYEVRTVIGERLQKLVYPRDIYNNESDVVT